MNVVKLLDRGRSTAAKPNAEAENAQAIRLWLQRIQARGDGAGRFSWERLCRKADTSPTNITRFLKDGVTVPRLSTLAKIADAAGVPLPGQAMTSDIQPLVDVPIILPHIFRTAGLQVAIMSSLDAVRSPSRFAHCVAVKVTADTGSLAGVLLGDVVIVDPYNDPTDNALVVVALDTGLSGIYRVQGEWLVPQAAGNLPSLRLAESHVMGVARQVQRELR